ncbi:MAG: CPBP family intramembrane metalloprotease [Coriobacteriales bacterium]|jgi:membrane protease YdiL (CAAX protease family)|nr:CPBP family intramembrane metalloprotease [Coriobacteriales bacterium]
MSNRGVRARLISRDIRRDIRLVCLCLGAFLLTIVVVQLLSMTVMAVIVLLSDPEILPEMGVAQDTMNLNISPYLDAQAFPEMEAFEDRLLDLFKNYSGLLSILGMVCGLPWFFLLRGKRFVTSDVTRRNASPKAATLAVLFILILAAQGLMILLLAALEPLLNQGGGSLVDTLEEATSALTQDPWGLLYVMVLGPVCEELVFRGAIMRRLEKHGANFAIVISALLFGLYHMLLFQVVFAFFVGLILAYTAGRFSLKWAMLLHIANNSLAVLTESLNSQVAEVFFTALFLCALIAAPFILFTQRKLLAAQRQAGAPLFTKTYAYAFSSPWIWILMVILTGSGVAMLGVF